jgi:NAD dependent epimerase/dehydratase family enzyme
MSWIHIDDLIAAMLRLLRDGQMHGPYNVTSPQPVTNAEFTRTLAAVLHRPAPFAAPAALLKLSLGEAAGMLLEGQRVLPKRLQAAQHRFAHPELANALDDLLSNPCD